MAIKDALLPEFDHEMATTRSLLAIVPEQHRDWLPHPKSYTLGRLAGHIANLPGWLAITMEATELDLNAAAAWTPPAYSTTLANVAYFDSMVTKARDLLNAATDADFMVGWTLRTGDVTHFTLPRVAVVRSFVLNHIIHHRGQLSVYLRLRDVPLPQIYGPTADTPM
jgi:uncharacterized damage-inducible protein DinB